MKLLPSPTRYVFFTGKGGVGKTSLSTATAIQLADGGSRVLLVSTDAASNLDEMLGVQLSNAATPVPGVPGLSVLNIDPNVAAEDYRQRVLSQMVAHSTEQEHETVREQLSGVCTTEIASFDEFSSLLSDGASAYDHVVFDTAPTGHTLRLLSLPKAWSGFLKDNDRGASCLGPHSGLKMQEARFNAALAALSDEQRTTVVLVARADAGSLNEAARTSGELRELGLCRQHPVANGVFRASVSGDALADALERLNQDAIDAMPAPLKALPQARVPLRTFDTVGLAALRALLDDPAALLMRRGHAVHLSTTDPAAHLASTLEGQLPGLDVSRIDPKAETQHYIDKVMATRGARLDAQEKALLLEDLQSPCTEEVAVFHAFSRTVSAARSAFVVLDTAPTGHSLLLMDATGAYHRQMTREYEGKSAAHLVTPLMRLQDASYTRIILVTLPETTPVSQAAALQDDLRRAHIEPHAWVVNKSILASHTRDPVLRARLQGERQQLARIEAGLAKRIFLIPWAPKPPVGLDGLAQLLQG